MTTTTAEYAKSETATEDYEPFMVGGEAIGDVRWIRTEGAEGATLANLPPVSWHALGTE